MSSGVAWQRQRRPMCGLLSAPWKSCGSRQVGIGDHGTVVPVQRTVDVNDRPGFTSTNAFIPLTNSVAIDRASYLIELDCAVRRPRPRPRLGPRRDSPVWRRSIRVRWLRDDRRDVAVGVYDDADGGNGDHFRDTFNLNESRTPIAAPRDRPAGSAAFVDDEISADAQPFRPATLIAPRSSKRCSPVISERTLYSITPTTRYCVRGTDGGSGGRRVAAKASRAGGDDSADARPQARSYRMDQLNLLGDVVALSTTAEQLRLRIGEFRRRGRYHRWPALLVTSRRHCV